MVVWLLFTIAGFCVMVLIFMGVVFSHWEKTDMSLVKNKVILRKNRTPITLQLQTIQFDDVVALYEAAKRVDESMYGAAIDLFEAVNQLRAAIGALENNQGDRS